MEREILFRGKRVDNGEWVEGYFVKYQPCANKDEWIFGIVPEYASALYLIEVDIKTVGRYTGLTDKNDRKIFEGDIIKNHKEDTGVIQWFKEHSAFMIFCTNPNRVYFLYDNDFSKIKVISNIHDNQDLMKGETND